jgi:uncharacterized protein (DUF1697 family)
MTAARYAVLLRAVNVGGHNKVPMPWLRDAATDAGFTDVATYVQSGNLVLSSTSGAAAVGKSVAGLIQQEHGLDIEVIVRSRSDLAAVIKANPFPDAVADPKLLHVSFLAGKPSAATIKKLDPEEFAPERFAVKGSELYLWYPNGSGRSKMAAAPWEKRLGVRGTARNWRTVTTLLEMLGG